MLRKEGMHGHSFGGEPPKPLCRDFGQLPKLTGDWVDHPDPTFQGMYSQVNTAPCCHIFQGPTFNPKVGVRAKVLMDCLPLSRRWLV